MNSEQASPGRWKTPEEVMKFHRLKRKLNKRMTEKSTPFTFSSNSTNSEESLMEFPVVKRKLPFQISERNVRKTTESNDQDPESGVEADCSSHSGERTLFNLLDRPNNIPCSKTPVSFSNIMNKLSPAKIATKVEQLESPPSVSPPKLGKRIPMDWSLKNKMRFMSTRPFSWSATMRTCEEVSAVTGFARCLEPGGMREGAADLDTSSNSQFHRCCLYWQHPHLPWLPLFTRSTSKLSPTLIAAQLQIAETLHQEWTLAFKSLLQLVRTQQCPYFYIIGTQFHCLFRAAGLGGESEVNALISPTTRGFRKMLEDEDITYTTPLRKKRKRQDSEMSMDSTASFHQTGNDFDDDDDDDDGDVEDWMDSDQVKKLTNAQKAKDIRKDSRVDGCDDSLVMVRGVDLQALFNLLVNCKNNMDRLPPTLVAPTAFQLATLKSCQVRDAVVRVDGVQLYSIQIEGPIMPHALAQMCLLLDEAKTEYSAAVATVKQTASFTSVHSQKDDKEPKQSLFFLKEYLTDCGLSKRVLSRLCESDPSQFGIVESIEPQQTL